MRKAALSTDDAIDEFRSAWYHANLGALGSDELRAKLSASDWDVARALRAAGVDVPAPALASGPDQPLLSSTVQRSEVQMDDFAPPPALPQPSGGSRLPTRAAVDEVAESVHVPKVAHQVPGFVEGTKILMASNKMYLLLLVCPAAAAAPALGWSDGAIFTLCCVAILPLAALLGDATEQVALHTNETLGGLLNATFGNATELIISYFLLRDGQLGVVQVSLLGSILSNTLLVLGFACLCAGFVKRDVQFGAETAGHNSSMLMIAILGLVLPTLMTNVGQFSIQGATDLFMSRFISVILLILYVAYIVFQFSEPKPEPKEGDEESSKKLVADDDDDDDDDEDEVIMDMPTSIWWLFASTVVLAYLSELLSDAIEGAAEQMHINKAFVGFVIIPIIGNAAEHSTAVVMALRLKMDLAISVALGSSTQIALFVIPVMVLLGWAIGQPLDLVFGSFETVITFLSAVIVAGIVNDGRTNWLEGMMLLASYIIICSAFFFYEKPVVVAAFD